MARKKKEHIKWAGAILVGILVVILIVTFTAKKASKRNTKQITIGISQEPDSLDPLFFQMMTSMELYGLLFEDMVERDDQWNLIPRLVTMIPSIENGLIKKLSNNRIEVTWNFKKDLKWSDGAPLTTQDFVFAHDLTMDDRIPVISRDVDRRIEKMETPDEITLIVTWKEPYAFANLGHSALPRHLLEPIYKQNPERYHESFYNRKPIGNGPYQLEEWASGSHLILTKNPYWYGAPPKLDKIIYRIIPNSNALESNLLSGTIDVISTMGLSLDQALDFEKRHGSSYVLHYKPSLIWEHMDCNLDNPILKDKHVRQALLYGAHRQKIVDVIFQGKQQVADSWLPPKHYGYDSNIRQYNYDPQKAKALLDEAGWVMTPSGYRVNKTGQKLQLTVMTTAGDKTREQIEQLFQADWKELGVGLEIENQPPKVFFGETIRKRKFTGLAMYASIFGPVSDGESSWTKENIPSEKNNWQGQNTTGWVHEESSRLLHQVPVTLEENKRRDLLYQQQVIWAEEIPSLPLFFKTEISVTDKMLKNWKPTGSLIPATWNAEEWYLEE